MGRGLRRARRKARAIVGPNGAGKSTLLKDALGLLLVVAMLGHIVAIMLPGWIVAKVGLPDLGATSSAAMMAVVAGVLFMLLWSVSGFREWLKRQRPGNASTSPA